MKRAGILNSDISRVLSYLGHTDTICIGGCGTASFDGGSFPFYKGDCVFVPADSAPMQLHGQAQFLNVRG